MHYISSSLILAANLLHIYFTTGPKAHIILWIFTLAFHPSVATTVSQIFFPCSFLYYFFVVMIFMTIHMIMSVLVATYDIYADAIFIETGFFFLF